MLSERRREFLADGEGLFTYESRVVVGDVFEGITSTEEDYSPDIVAFGRHKTLHRRPLGIGRVPFHAMLNLAVPILVV